eukprot:TRINITY_DN516103_c0_g1_i1.p1 TRINITY_DN516103_c0_g1~~TRINITY_DN516103_c0_g1_i1.p1  ORF type:complete len:301 (+),score=80.68 TRINITY_DN516103_c0_g1_i1:114-905(+)
MIEHFMREPTCVGALFGCEAEGDLQVFASEQLILKDDHFDDGFLKGKMDLMTQVYPDWELVGWYCVSNEDPNNLPIAHNIQKQLLTINESAILIVMKGEGDYGVSAFEHEFKEIDGVRHFGFNGGIEIKVDSTDAERITVNQITNITNHSTSTPFIDSAANACQRLSEQIGQVIGFLEGVKEGKITPKPGQLRDLAKFASSLSVANMKQYDEKFNQETEDGILTNSLAMAAKLLVRQERLDTLQSAEADSSLSSPAAQFNTVY